MANNKGAPWRTSQMNHAVHGPGGGLHVLIREVACMCNYISSCGSMVWTPMWTPPSSLIGIDSGDHFL